MKKIFKTAAIIALLSFMFSVNLLSASATPFYALNPRKIVLRGSFYTTYSASSPERKHNIELCAATLNNTLIAPDGEFSFNYTVGPRTVERGYKEAKIIIGGAFSDGVGGGVCQVSSTLYNALLLSGIKVTECHRHTLQVGYVAPSFDAMVNYYYADLKFINDTDNPMYIKTFTDGEILKVFIYGESSGRKYERKSVITEILPQEEEIIIDEAGEFPELKKGEKRVLSYGREGIKSEGYILEYDYGGRLISQKKIREDKYAGIKTVVVEGTADFPLQEPEAENVGELSET